MDSFNTAKNAESNSFQRGVGLVSALRPWGIQSCQIKEPAYKFPCFSFQVQSQKDREKRDRKAIKSNKDEQEKIVDDLWDKCFEENRPV